MWVGKEATVVRDQIEASETRHRDERRKQRYQRNRVVDAFLFLFGRRSEYDTAKLGAVGLEERKDLIVRFGIVQLGYFDVLP